MVYTKIFFVLFLPPNYQSINKWIRNENSIWSFVTLSFYKKKKSYFTFATNDVIYAWSFQFINYICNLVKGGVQPDRKYSNIKGVKHWAVNPKVQQNTNISTFQWQNFFIY